MTNQLRTLRNQPWDLWLLQGLRLTRIELRRNLFSPRSGWIYFLAFIPTALLLVQMLFQTHPVFQLVQDTTILAGVVEFYYIRLGIFFGCLGIFSRLIRGEMVERSLHFYLLSPVRREILLLAKFAAGSISAICLFGSAMIGNFLLMYGGYGPLGREYILNGPGLSQLGSYLVIVALACLGYGSIFLLLSMKFRNPAPAAMILLGWEVINPVLPSLLQKLSVASYLRHLMPVTVPARGIFALLSVETESVPAWAATAGLLVLTTFVLVWSCYRMRRLEIRYTTE
jgi:hypothetical protein